MRPRTEHKLHKLLRLGAFLLFVQALVTALVVRGVRAEVQDLMLSVGSQMMQIGERVGSAQPRTLRINGAELRLRVQRVPKLTLDEVLDVFESRCRARNGRFYEQLKEQASPQLNEPQWDLLDGVMRVQSKEAGAVACFDVGDERGSPQSILERAQRFAATGDASSFGDLRYMRAEQRDAGVFLVAMWTDGPFNIKQMFPTEGDAPGVDFSDLPRPPGSRRIFSAWEEGEAPALNIYESSQRSPKQLDQHYRAALEKLGWKALTPPVVSKREADPRGLMVMRDGVTVTVSHSALEGGKLGMTTIAPADTGGATSVSVR